MATSTSDPAVPVDVPPRSRPPVAGPGRWAPLAATGFVAAALAGNSLTEAVDGGFAARAVSDAYRAGIAVEVAGLSLLVVFLAWCWSLLGGRASRTLPLGLTAGTAFVALKLGSGAALLAGCSQHETLGRDAERLLVALNDAAFVLGWPLWGLFLLGVALGCRAAGRVGRVVAGVGLVLGVLTSTLGIIGAGFAALAVPIPFLLSLLWLAFLGIRLAVSPSTPGR